MFRQILCCGTACAISILSFHAFAADPAIHPSFTQIATNDSDQLDVPDWAVKDFHEASQAKQRGDFGKAIQLYSDILNGKQLSPRVRSAAYVSRGDAYVSKGRLDLAIGDCLQAAHLTSVPSDLTGIYLLLGATYSRKGDYDNAIATLTRVIGLDPKNAINFADRAFAYAGVRNFQAALSDEQAALSLKPDLADGQKNLELLKDALANAAKSPQSSASAAEENPDDLLIIFNPAAPVSQSADIARDPHGELHIDHPTESDVCLPDGWNVPIIRSTPAPKYDGYKEFLSAEVSKRFPGFDVLSRLSSPWGCIDRITNGPNGRPLYVYPRYAVGQLPPGTQIVMVVPWSQFQRFKVEKAGRAKLAATRLAAIEAGSVTGAGFLLVDREGDICIEHTDDDLWQALFKSQADKFAKFSSLNGFNEGDSEAILRRLKSGPCGYFFGSAETIKVIAPALARDGRPVELDPHWIPLEQVTEMEKQLAEEKQRRLAAEKAAPAFTRSPFYPACQTFESVVQQTLLDRRAASESSFVSQSPPYHYADDARAQDVVYPGLGQALYEILIKSIDLAWRDPASVSSSLQDGRWLTYCVEQVEQRVK
jgi:tetratricopeptide (TPR) repeat protein